MSGCVLILVLLLLCGMIKSIIDDWQNFPKWLLAVPAALAAVWAYYERKWLFGPRSCRLGQALLREAALGSADAVARLLAKGADPNSVSDADTAADAAKVRPGLTALHVAIEAGHREVAAALLDHGADVNAQGVVARAEGGETPLHKVAAGRARGDAVEWLEFLIARGAEVNSRDTHGRTPLHYAIRGNLKLAQRLLERGADLNALDERGQTPIAAAAEGGCVSVLEQLCERGYAVPEQAVARAKRAEAEQAARLARQERQEAQRRREQQRRWEEQQAAQRARAGEGVSIRGPRTSAEEGGGFLTPREQLRMQHPGAVDRCCVCGGLIRKGEQYYVDSWAPGHRAWHARCTVSGH